MPPCDPLDDDRLTLVGLLLETVAGLERAFARGAAGVAGLSAPWFDVLIRLARTPGNQLRMTDLARQSTLTPSGLTRAVDRLEAAGLVRRDSCPTDRRGAYATLTDEGMATVRAAVVEHLNDIDATVGVVLNDREQAELAALLRKVRDRVHPGGGPPCPPCAPGAGWI
jgi:DNA-binding MarR family transcriptional regulator